MRSFVSRPAFIAAVLSVALAAAAHADAIDPCSLLSDADKAELGVPKDSAPSRQSQPGGVQACKYRFEPADAAPGSVVSIILSQQVPERVLQLRAMQTQAREQGTPAQQQARGDYFEDGVMCKVVLSLRQETSQCIGASEQSVVALTVSRPSSGDKAAYPALQLRIISALVARVGSKGG